MASLRNLVISLLRLTEAKNMASALRPRAPKTHRPLRAIMGC